MMTKIRTIIICICILLCTYVDASANETTDLKMVSEYKKELFQSYEKEYSELEKLVKKEIKQDEESEKNIIGEENMTKKEIEHVLETMTIDKVDVKNAYKVKLLENLGIDLLTCMKKGNDIKTLISGREYWMVPGEMQSGQKYIIQYKVETDGTLCWAEETIYEEDDEKIDVPDNVDVIFNMIERTLPEGIEGVEYLYASYYDILMVYFWNDKKEYVIPYTQIDEMEIDNGKVYTLKDFSDIMNRTVEEPVGMEEGEGGAAVGISHSGKKMIVFVFVVVIIFSMFFVWNRKKEGVEEW